LTSSARRATGRGVFPHRYPRRGPAHGGDRDARRARGAPCRARPRGRVPGPLRGGGDSRRSGAAVAGVARHVGTLAVPGPAGAVTRREFLATLAAAPPALAAAGAAASPRADF